MYFFYKLGTVAVTRMLDIYNYLRMIISYNQLSREIGYEGTMPYPSMEDMDRLVQRLNSDPTTSDFKQALSLYRFMPEAKTHDQEKMVYKLQMVLATAKDQLFRVEPKRSFSEVAINYVLKLIPSIALFYIVRFTVIGPNHLFQF